MKDTVCKFNSGVVNPLLGRDNLAFTDLDWDNLITFIQEGQVVPIIGKELSLITNQESGEKELFDCWLARKLAERLGEFPYEEGSSLNRVVCSAIKAGNKLPGLVATIKRLISSHQFEIPEALRLLGEITDFKIFLTTAIDPMLGYAITEVRGGCPPAIYSYGPKRFDDIPAETRIIALGSSLPSVRTARFAKWWSNL